MNFREFMQQLEKHLGYHQIPLNPAARGIKDIFEGSPLHHDLVTRLVKAIYTENHCRHLGDAVTREASFNALSPIRLETLRSTSTDVDLFHLVEEFGVAIEKIFTGSAVRHPGAAEPVQTREKPEAEIISLQTFLRGRRLKSWA